jgi:hypothetical protein
MSYDMRFITFLSLLLLTFSAQAFAQQQWFSVMLDGRKIGSFENRRSVADSKVTTHQELSIEFDRAGTSILMQSAETTVESLAGEPLSFKTHSVMSGSESTVMGEIHGERLRVRMRIAGEWQEREIEWPEGALLAEGLRLSSRKMPLKPGSQYQQLSFQPSGMEAVLVNSTIGALESVTLPAGRKKLHRVEQIFNFNGAPIRNTAWVDDQHEIHKLSMPVLGVELVLMECDRACATAPNQSSNIFDRTLMRSSRALSHTDREKTLRYTLRARDREPLLPVPSTSEQKVSKRGRELIIEVRREPDDAFGDAPEPADYATTDWLQSDAPEVIELAQRATRTTGNDFQRMQTLENFVSQFINDKNLSVGYASALEVARKPEGDCTEHAVLLAALGRSLGIATRVVYGLAYASEFGGSHHVFVPHAWVQAWVKGRWQSFDAALGGFDSGHIAFSTGDGDPWRFYQGVDLLGRVELKRIETLGPASGKQ